jgi:C_GCAxxG_C_C family probable redox protein
MRSKTEMGETRIDERQGGISTVNDGRLKKKLDDLAERVWETAAIEARVRGLSAEGIPPQKLDPVEMLARKEEILNRVQLRAEEYNFILKNCAQGTALALLEEFGLGSMEIIQALTPFPGIGGTGEICGGITGSLIAFGLFFGSDDRLDYEALNNTILTAQKFMAFFEGEIGHLHCSDIIETVILGQRLNPGESEEAMMTFAKEKGFEKCGLPPGIGARLAAGLMIDSMIRNS